jgi:hypothetical protein
MNLFIKTEVKVNDKDHKRCSIHCQHIEKKGGNYVCVLFGDAEVDTGDDDDIGYGFARTEQCIDSVLDI